MPCYNPIIIIDNLDKSTNNDQNVNNLLASLWLQGYPRQNIHIVKTQNRLNYSSSQLITHILDGYDNSTNQENQATTATAAATTTTIFLLLRRISSKTIFLQGPKELIKAYNIYDADINSNTRLYATPAFDFILGKKEALKKWLIRQDVNNNNVDLSTELPDQIEIKLFPDYQIVGLYKSQNPDYSEFELTQNWSFVKDNNKLQHIKTQHEPIFMIVDDPYIYHKIFEVLYPQIDFENDKASSKKKQVLHGLLILFIILFAVVLLKNLFKQYYNKHKLKHKHEQENLTNMCHVINDNNNID